MPELERQTPRMYSEQILPDGTISELFGCGCDTCAGAACDIDEAKGGARGDDNPVYILDVYMNYAWHKDGEDFLKSVWGPVSKAINFTLSHAQEYGLTYRMVNTNDEHGLIGDINTYNAFAYLASTAACTKMAPVVGDAALASQCVVALAAGREALDTILWANSTGGGGFWRQAACKPTNESVWEGGTALQGGGLYGMLWAEVLGLGDAVGVPVEKLRQHLQQERERNLGPFGLVFVTNRTYNYYGHGCSKMSPTFTGTSTGGGAGGGGGMRTGFIDQDVWNSHSQTHAAMSLYTGHGSAADALGVAGAVMDAYRVTMADQW